MVPLVAIALAMEARQLIKRHKWFIIFLEVRTKTHDGCIFPVVERYGMDLKTMMVYYYDIAEDSYLLIKLK